MRAVSDRGMRSAESAGVTARGRKVARVARRSHHPVTGEMRRAGEVSAAAEVPSAAHGGPAAHVAATTSAHVAAATSAHLAAATAAGMLGISQTRRTRYRKAEQQGSDYPNNACRVHVHHPVLVAMQLLRGRFLVR